MEPLVDKAAHGDRNAFIKLIEPRKEQIYKTAFVQLSNEQDAMDAVQETILKAFERIHTLRNGHYFYTWLIRILLNECHNIQRRNKKVVFIDSRKIEDALDKKCMDSYPAEYEDMLKNLGEIHRTVIDLRYNQDLSISQIAEVLDIPEGTVKSRLNKAIKKLRVEIDGKEEAL